jgi:hypothetical protein
MNADELQEFSYAYGTWMLHPKTGEPWILLDTHTRLSEARKFRDELAHWYPELQLTTLHRGDIPHYGIPSAAHDKTH